MFLFALFVQLNKSFGNVYLLWNVTFFVWKTSHHDICFKSNSLNHKSKTFMVTVAQALLPVIEKGFQGV